MQTMLCFTEGLMIYKPGLDYGKNGGDQLVIMPLFFNDNAVVSKNLPIITVLPHASFFAPLVYLFLHAFMT